MPISGLHPLRTNLRLLALSTVCALAGCNAPVEGGDGLLVGGTGARGPRTFRVSAGYINDDRPEYLGGLDELRSRCFVAGDEVLFRGGETFRGSLPLTLCSNPGSGSIKLSTFGDGGRATIVNTHRLDDLGLRWEPVDAPMVNGRVVEHLRGKNLYRAGPLPDRVRQAFYEGASMHLARTPNRGTAINEIARYERITEVFDECGFGTCLRSDGSDGISLLKRYGLSGSEEVVVRTTAFSLDRHRVQYVDPDWDSISFDRLSSFVRNGDASHTRPGYGFFPMNSLAFVDADKEWHFDSASSSLFFLAPSGPPDPALTELSLVGDGSTIDADFQNSSIDLEVGNLNFVRSPDKAIRFVNGRSLDVNNVGIAGAQQGGILGLTLAGDASVTNSSIQHTPGNGVTLIAVAGAMTVANNQVSNSGFVENQPSLDMNFNGVWATGGSSLDVTDNIIEFSGYAGVLSGNISGTVRVRNNRIRGYCALLNDCGGIYFNASAPVMQVEADREIASNTLEIPFGTVAGTPSSWRSRASGIYLDFAGSYFDVTGNTIRSRSTRGGIFLHGGDHNFVSENSVVALSGNAIGLTTLTLDGVTRPMTENIIRSNDFEARSSNDAVVRLSDSVFGDPAALQEVFEDTNRYTHTTRPDFIFELLGANPPPLRCGADACDAQEAECGSVVDECGDTVQCADYCSPPESCGGGGTPNRCGGGNDDICGRAACTAAGAECGTITDDCGDRVDCPNSCRAPETCGGGGTPNRCGGDDSCRPRQRWTSKATFSQARNLPVGGADLSWLNVNQGVQFDGFGSRIICPSVPMSQVSDRLYLTGAGLSVPSGATIVGVEVSFSMRRDGTDPELDRVNIMTGSFPSPSKVSANLARSQSVSFSENYRHVTFGGSANTWSLRLTPEEVNSAGFGTMINVRYGAACDAPNTQFVVDAAEVRVRYEEPCE